MSDDVILLSSDDEFETPPAKKSKPNYDLLEQLHNLKEITAAKYETPAQIHTFQRTSVIKTSNTEQNSFTIIIDGDENCNKTEEAKSKENNSVVNLIDESFEDTTSEQKNNLSSDCLIVASDSESEDSRQATPENLPAEPPAPPPLPPTDPAPSNGHIEAPPEPDILQRPSTSTASDAHKLLDEFLETCAKSLKASKYESRVLPIFPKMKKHFDKCSSIHSEPNFKRMLQEHIITAKISAPEAVVSFQRLYSYLMEHINGESVEVAEEDLLKIKALERTCKILLKKLKKLEAAEINFDDEEDSVYIQVDRYSQRLNKVYNKYCQLLKRNPHAGRLVNERVQFVSSKYNEINRAITKSYKNNKFPSYYEVEKCVRKCNTKHNLGLAESEILEESKNSFTKMGNLLQMRRKKELYEVHCGYIALNEDPASTDDGLKAKLQESSNEGEKKMKEVVDKFVKMQENNVSVEMSEDSDDSNFKESDSETEACEQV